MKLRLAFASLLLLPVVTLMWSTPQRAARRSVSTAPCETVRCETPDPIPARPSLPKIRSKDRSLLVPKEDRFGIKSDRYGATFAPGFVEFALPVELEGLGRPSLRYGLARVNRMAENPGAAPTARNGIVVYDRGLVEERFLLREDGIEHVLVISEPTRDDVNVSVDVTTALSPRSEGERVTYRWNDQDVLAISQAVAVDADGRRLPLTLSENGGEVSFRVPGEWMAQASYPVEIDPLIGGLITVSSNNAYAWIKNVDVAYNSLDQQWLVVWSEQYGGSTFDYDIFGRVLSSNGTPIGSDLWISFTNDGAYECSVAYAANLNRYLVVWANDAANDGNNFPFIHGRVVHGNGGMDLAWQISPAQGVGHRNPDVASDGSKWLVAWTHWNNSEDPDLWCTMVNVDGTPGGLTLLDNDGPNVVAAGPAIAYGGGMWLVVYEKGFGTASLASDGSTATVNSPSLGIMGRYLYQNGSFGATVWLHSYSESGVPAGRPDVAAGNGSFLVVWNREWGTTDRDIYGKIVTGGSLSGTLMIKTDVIDQRRPKAAWSETSQQWLAVWEDFFAGDWDVYAKRVTPSGEVLDQIVGVPVSSSVSTDAMPALAWNPATNEMLVAWDYAMGSEIRAHRFAMGNAGPQVPADLTQLKSDGETVIPFGGSTNETTVIFEGDVGNDAMQVEIKPFGTAFDGQGLLTGTSVVAEGLSGGSYHWRARTIDEWGLTSGWVEAGGNTGADFSVVTPVTLLEPANGSVVGDSTPTFKWYFTSGATEFWIQVADDAAFTQLKHNVSGLSTNQFTPSAPLNDGTYYWRVRAKVGDWGEWSATWSVAVDTVLPGAPEPQSPADGSATNDTTPTFAWSPVAGASGYRIQVDKEGTDFDPYYFDVITTSTTFTYWEPLPNATFYWRVQAKDAADNWGPFSPIRTLKVVFDFGGPTAPVLVSPAEGSVTNESMPTFVWSAASDPSGVAGYRLEVYKNNVLHFDVQTTATSFTYWEPLPNGNFTWRVQAKDIVENWGSWSSLGTFLISSDATGPSAVTPIAPTNSSTINDTTPTFVWTAASDPSGVAGYRLRVDKNGANVFEVLPSTNSFTYWEPLSDGSYSWKVQAKDSLGNWGAWSAVFTFALIDDSTGPAPVSLVSPVNGAVINDFTPEFVWSAASDPSGVTGYRLQVDKNGSDFDPYYFDVIISGTSFTYWEPLGDGVYSWRVQAKDTLGNWGAFSAVGSFTITSDSVAPETTFTQTPPASTPSTNATFAFTSTEPGTFERQLDSGAWTVVTSPESLSGLTTGSHTYRVRAIDAVGNVDPTPAEYTWTIGTPPASPTISSPGAATNDTTPTLTGTAAAGVTVKVYDGSTLLGSTSSNGSWSFTPATPLSAGTHSFTAVAVDSAGLQSQPSAAVSLLIDTTPPVAGAVQDGTGADVDTQLSTTTISANWSGFSDGESGVAGYEWAIGTSSGGTQIQTFQSVGSATSATKTGLSLTPGSTIFVSVRATNGAGSNVVAISDGVQIASVPAPTALGQFKSDGTTVIAVGGSTNELQLIVKGTLGAAGVLQVEIKSAGTPFDGTTNLSQSALLSAGATASVTISALTNGVSYHWRARVLDASGNGSDWVGFGNNPEPGGIDVTIAVPPANSPPVAPSAAGQFHADGLTPIPAGGTTNGATVVFKASLTDPDGNAVSLAVEVKPLGTPFIGTATATSAPVASGSNASIAASGLTSGSYHWQAWTVDSAGAQSGVVSLGGSPDFIVDIVTNAAPANPTALGQFKSDGTTAIAPGGTTGETQVVFKAQLSDTDPGQGIKLQVELKAAGTPFDGAISAESAFVTSGAIASATVGALVSNGYHWRCRAKDAAGTTSAWVPFGSGTDFLVVTASNGAPQDPTALGQFQADGSTAISPGATISASTVALKGTVTDPDGTQAKLQVEVKPVSVPFDGTFSAESGWVASGGVASISISGLANGSYHWRARAADPSGAFSSWIVFSATDPDFIVATTSNQVPNSPTLLFQKRTEGTTIAVSGSTNESMILLGGTVSDPDVGGVLKLQVELRPVWEPFTGTPTATGAAVANGSVATVSHGGLLDGVAYHWQVRTMDANDAVSPWVSFGGNPDFTKTVNTAPQVPLNLEQVVENTSVLFQAIGSDPDGDWVRLQVEVRPVGEPFGNVAMVTGEAASSEISAPVSDLVNGTGYHWQARVIDSSGATSAWISFGGNSEDAADFLIGAVAASGESGGGCAGSVTQYGLPNGLVVVLAGLLLLIGLARRA